jgi:hypothetical protein
MEHYMEHQSSMHLKKFNDRVQVMNQTNARDLTLTALDARNLQAEIFELLTKINDLVERKKEQKEEVINVDVGGGNF